MIRPDTLDYERLFLEDIPLLDVRAQIEYVQGAFPHSQNIPLLDDAQRQMIGKQYKTLGQDAAIDLGLQLATPEIREQRIAQWKQFVKTHPEGYLYCFRGGLRSQTAQAWLREQGLDYPLIQGGYKALRTYLLQELERSAEQLSIFLLSGLTGSGKTHLLHKIRYHIDLEGLSNHRGSAFGAHIHDPQPTQINFENSLSVACLKYRHHFPESGLLLEDEGKKIGKNMMPLCFREAMEQAPVLFLECALEERVAIIREEYIAQNWPLYQLKYQAEAPAQFSHFVIDNLGRIKKRLGSMRYKNLSSSFELALEHLFATGKSDLFDAGIRLLLEEYYDPMYQYQLEKKQLKFVFQGTEAEILDWVNQHISIVKSCS